MCLGLLLSDHMTTCPLHLRSRVPRFETFKLLRGERFSLHTTWKSSSPHHPRPRAVAGGGGAGGVAGLEAWYVFAFTLLQSGETLFNLFRSTYHAYISENPIKINHRSSSTPPRLSGSLSPSVEVVVCRGPRWCSLLSPIRGDRSSGLCLTSASTRPPTVTRACAFHNISFANIPTEPMCTLLIVLGG